HEHPREEDLRELCETMKEIGLPQAEYTRLHAAIMSRSRLPQALQDLSEYYTGTPLSRFVNQHILRALMRARYSHEDLGHFGLATRGYLHFTSPIRRYPDLVIHRLVKMALRDAPLSGKERTKLNKYLKYVGSETSRREETTDEAMMEAVKLKAALFMARRIGHEFSAVVTSIVPYGMFVEVTDPPVDGLIPAAPKTHGRSWRGRKQRPNIHPPRIGDVVTVRLTRVDRLKGLLDFTLVDEQGENVKR
ncbi:MAG: RNB domain-containing ribonuclease, partial [Desulfomonilia bacterium]